MPRRRLRIPAAVAAALIAIGAPAVAVAEAGAPAAKTVNCNTGDLQSALNAAPDGGTVTVKGTCDGSFDINKNLTLEGAPTATIDGEGTYTALSVADGLHVTLAHLTIQDGGGSEVAAGGLDISDKAHLKLTYVNVTNNQSYGNGAGVLAGDDSVVTASHGSFSHNHAALVDNTPVDLAGAAIYSTGTVTLDHTTVDDNSLSAQSSSESSASGGAVYDEGKLTIRNSSFGHNLAGSQDAFGGSIYANGDAVTISSTTFAGDKALGEDTDNSSEKSSGGSLFLSADRNTLNRVRVTGSYAIVNSPNGGSAAGGALRSIRPITITDSTFADNGVEATEASGTDGVTADGGALDLEDESKAEVSRSTISGNTTTASAADATALARGGGIFASGNDEAATLTDSTIADNSSTATRPKGSPGSATALATGGGVQDESHHLTFRYDTVAGNTAKGATTSQGGGLDITTGLALPKPTTVGSIWAANTAHTGPQCDGGFHSSGWNLFSGLRDCATATKHSDKAHGRARLGTLAANGGPTKTMALGRGSQALDRVPRKTCRAVVTKDQRGVPRPQGAATNPSHRRCDEGAYEKKVTRHRR